MSAEPRSPQADPGPAAAGPAPLGADAPCGRCGYNLRGAVRGCCPECGLEFDLEEARRGFVREHLPTRLDRADPWQPHQVALACVAVIASTIAAPARTLRSLDLRPEARAAWRMLFAGLGWVFVVTAGLLATAALRSGLASPHSALAAAVAIWAPALLATYLLTASAALPLVLHGQVLRLSSVSRWQAVRVACHWIPAHLACCALPAAAVLAFVPAAGVISAATGALAGLAPLVAVWRSLPSRSARPAADAPAWVLLALIGVAAGGLGAMVAVPRDFSPPLWLLGL